MADLTSFPPVAAPMPSAVAPVADSDAALRDVARKLETSFLAEMLKSAGLSEARDSFGGGTGEEQFSSFLRQEQATLMVRAGGIGLAEQIFESLKGRADAAR